VLRFGGKHNLLKSLIIPQIMAVFMLMFAGATFTHHDELPHLHDIESASADTSSVSHDHGGSASIGDVADADPLHCGSNILALEAMTFPALICSKQLHESGMLSGFAGRLLFYDPPPPRQYS